MICAPVCTGCRYYPHKLIWKLSKSSMTLFFTLKIFRWQMIYSSRETYTIGQIFASVMLTFFPLSNWATGIHLKGHWTQNSNFKKRGGVSFWLSGDSSLSRALGFSAGERAWRRRRGNGCGGNLARHRASAEVGGGANSTTVTPSSTIS